MYAKTEREQLLHCVQMYDFATAEAALYLDTHPCDMMALTYFNQYKDMAKKAEQEYVEKYGPLNHRQVTAGQNHWEWVDGPWPWEAGGN